MKKMIKIFIGLLIILFLCIFYMDYSDRHYQNKLEKKIMKHTELKKINYINYYDDYYIVLDDNYLYLFDKKYKELLKEDVLLVYKNKNNYDIIYKDGKFMYLSDTIEKKKLVYRYYDIHSYELIDEVFVRGA